MGLSPPIQSRVFTIARTAIRDRLLRGDRLPVSASLEASHSPVLPPELTEPAGCFISLHERRAHRLRGCVGRIDPNLPLHEAVRQTASDVLHDPRFTTEPVTPDDLDKLDLEISVLSPPRHAASTLVIPPFQVDLTQHIDPESTAFDLEIDVANTLGPYMAATTPTPFVLSGQTVSGLFGPVRLLTR